MNAEAQASSPAVVGSQDRSEAASATAFVDSASAAASYCSARIRLTLSASALLLNPNCSSSMGNAFAGCVVSPSRSRTVLL